MDAIGYQLRNIESQVLAFPGSDVHSMLDDIIERNDILADPLAELSADREIRTLLTPDEGAKERMARAAGARALLKH